MSKTRLIAIFIAASTIAVAGCRRPAPESAPTEASAALDHVDVPAAIEASGSTGEGSAPDVAAVAVPTVPPVCGGVARLRCPDTHFCDFADGTCHTAEATGTCEPRPDACTMDYSPVCGCDGITYANACGAHAVGVDVGAPGECPAEGSGGLGSGAACTQSGPQCGTGLVCDLSADTTCDPAASGTCVQSETRVCTREYNPVCGCDGRTYGNDCSRAAQYIGRRSYGECRP